MRRMDRQTDERTEATLIAPFLTVGNMIIAHFSYDFISLERVYWLTNAKFSDIWKLQRYVGEMTFKSYDMFSHATQYTRVTERQADRTDNQVRKRYNSRYDLEGN